MKQNKELKSDHALRLNITAQDEYYYKEPLPLSDTQKEALLSQEHEIRLEAEHRLKMEERWRVRRYEGTTDKEEKLWQP